MKTIAPLFLLLFVASCSQTPSAPKFEALPTARIEPAATAQSNLTQVQAEPVTPPVQPAAESATAVNTNANPSPRVAPPTVTAVTPEAPRITPGVPPQTTPAAPGPVAGALAPGATANPAMEEAFTLDARLMPLDQVLELYAKVVNRTLLRPANLGAQQVTLRTQTPLTMKEAVQALDAVLGMNGIAMINVGDKFVKVVPVTDAPGAGAEPDARSHDEMSNLGPYITHIVQTKYLKPSEVQAAIQPFARMPNGILAFDASQILVLRDYTENVKRMLEMLDRIDVAVPAEFISEVIPIKYAKASEIADALNSLSGGGGGAASIGRTAQPAARTPGTVSNLSRPGAQGYNPANPTAGVGGGAAGAASSTFSGRLQRLVERASASGDLVILGQTKMIADERSNSLLIFASRQDMDMIKSIVSKLDVVMAQVVIETVIMDVQMGSSLSYGVSAGQHPKTNKLGAIGGVYNNSGALGTLGQFLSGSLTNDSAFPSSGGLSYFGKYKGDLDVAIQAAAGDSRVNVIQKPRIVTSHAKTGHIFIGSTVPYVTGSSYGGAYGAGNTYQQLSVGIGLDVTPYINPDGLVVMEITETIDEISGSIDIQNVGAVPTTTTRQIQADVAVRDGDTIMLGGFIRNSSNKQNAGVPLLKDIPLLGALFSSRSDNKERKELLVMMRPTVLKTPEIAALATLKEKDRMPGIRQAEQEVLDLERKDLKRDAKKAAKTPVFEDLPISTEK